MRGLVTERGSAGSDAVVGGAWKQGTGGVVRGQWSVLKEMPWKQGGSVLEEMSSWDRCGNRGGGQRCGQY